MTNEKLREEITRLLCSDPVCFGRVSSATIDAIAALSSTDSQSVGDDGEHKRCPWCKSEPAFERSELANRVSYRVGCPNNECSVQPHAASSISIAKVWEQWDALSAMSSREAGLREALQAVHDDLLMRAETEDDGTKVVAVGRGVWVKVCAALNAGGDRG